jgi:DnaJ homolog subfamily B member 4
MGGGSSFRRGPVGMGGDPMFDDYLGGAGGMGAGGGFHPGFHPSSADRHGPRRPRKDPPLEMKLPCTLEELYTGSQRKMKISRRRMDQATGTARTETDVLVIDVKPGWKKGTKITFQEKGDENPGRIAADIVFVIDEKPHATYTREGNDLVVTRRLPLRESLTGVTVELATLDGRALRVQVDEVIPPRSMKVVRGEGMPVTKTPGTKGDLRIRFEVAFPRELSAAQKEVLRQVLPAE